MKNISKGKSSKRFLNFFGNEQSKTNKKNTKLKFKKLCLKVLEVKNFDRIKNCILIVNSSL